MVALQKWLMVSFTTGKNIGEIILFNLEKLEKTSTLLNIEKGFKGTVVNQALATLHGGSLEN